jgi:hypothetical protein
MQVAARQTTLQRCIDGLHAEGQRRAGGVIGLIAFDFRHGLPQTAKGG